MRSADFLKSSLIVLDLRISLGHIKNYFRHSFISFLKLTSLSYTNKSKTLLIIIVLIYKDYLSYLEPFRHSVTGDALLATIKMDFHHLA
jgi:hypothetical protein